MGVSEEMRRDTSLTVDYLLDKVVEERLARMEALKLVDDSVAIFKKHNETIASLESQRDDWRERATEAEERATRLEAERDDWEDKYRRAIRGELEC